MIHLPSPAAYIKKSIIHVRIKQPTKRKAALFCDGFLPAKP